MFHAKETAQENPRAYLLNGTGEVLDRGIHLEHWSEHALPQAMLRGLGRPL